jgi:hypothetical protein
MADLTQTITESMTMLGMGEVALWGVFEWGENWGYTGELETETDKCLTNSLAMTDSRSNEVDLEPFGNSIGIDESVVEANSTSWSAVSDGSGDWEDA